MVNPYITVLRIQPQAVVHTVEYGKVAELCTADTASQDTESVDGGIFADTFKGQVDSGVSLAFHLQPFCRRPKVVHIVCGDSTEDTYCQRAALVAFLVGGDDRLQTGAGGLCRTARLHAERHGLGIGSRYIQHACTALERTIIVVRTDALGCVGARVGKAVAVVRFHYQVAGHDCGCALLYAARNGHYFQ